MRDHLVVEPPSDPARKERIEREVLARVDAERSRPFAAEPTPGRGPWIVAAAAMVAAVAAVTLWFAWPRAATPAKAASAAPSLIVTPAGNGSRVALEGAIVDVAADTAVEVQPGPGGALTLDLRRGAVDCDVTPRGIRPPFVVIAGDVRVEVVGTRFSVTRGDQVRVDVTRGKVRVIAPDGTHLVAAGEVWSSEPVAVNVPDPEPAHDAPAPDPDPVTPKPTPKPAPAPRPTSHDAFLAAQKLQRSDPDAAARAYRVVAKGKDAWAAVALYNLAELEAGRHHAKAALDALDDYDRRFRSGANAEDAAWLRVEVLRASGDTSGAKAAADRYLVRFPDGTYAAAAKQRR